MSEQNKPTARWRGSVKQRAALAAVLGAAVALTVVVAVAHSVGYQRGGSGTPTVDAAPGEAAATTWTCSMHPQIQLPKPGKCPICFMDLIPLSDDSTGTGHPRQLKMSPSAVALAEIQTTPARREHVTKTVRMFGKVEFDETRVSNITAWVPGRLDRLFVDFTGVIVRKGDHLVELYSPSLIVAQRELIATWRAQQRLPEKDRGLTAANLRSATEKLRLLGVLPEQIEEIKRLGKPIDHLTIYAPIGGIVIEKHANEGMYVQTGTKIYTIADLSTVWVFLDAYESDLRWLRYGQQVRFTTESHPGEVFDGRIVFIDPILDKKTRSVKVRVNVSNPQGKLKPGMFVRARAESRLAAGGKVFDPSLAGKWISPMHPEIIKDGPGKCDVCGMDLVPAEELGYRAPDKNLPAPIVIPATAPLITGKRAVVYVRLPGEEQPVFEGREVVLGERAGDLYLVRHGLEEGDLVVTRGNFKIDSALQIQARPSMMSPDDTAAGEALTIPSRFREQLAPVYDAYLELQTALADDRLPEAKKALGRLQSSLSEPDELLLDDRPRQAWRTVKMELAGAIGEKWQDADVDEIRKRFEPLSNTMLSLAAKFGHVRDAPLHRAFCPMAFDDKGAAWLQSGKKIANPYFGHQMLRCGAIQREFPPAEGKLGSGVRGQESGARGKEDRHEH